MGYDENFDWIGKNYKELVKKYRDKWIAVLDCKVVGFDESLEKLKKKMKAEYPDKFDEIVFEFITDKKFPDWDSG